MRSPSIQTRIVALFLALVVFVQVGGLLLIDSVGEGTARRAIDEDVAAGANVFLRLREQERTRFVQAARLLSADPAFLRGISSRDPASTAQLVARYGQEIDAGLVMLVRADKIVVADTLDVGVGDPFLFPRLLESARAQGAASAMVVVRGQLFQLVVVPMQQSPIAWLAVGYAMNDAYARDMARLLRLDVSFATRLPGGDWRLQATTLPSERTRMLLRELAADAHAAPKGRDRVTHDDLAVTRALSLPAHTDDAVVAVLQQPLSTALAPFKRLERELAWISLLVALVSLVASVMIARGVVHPVRALAGFARRMAAGDYSTIPPPPRNDEIGDLANAFRTMQAGLASREERIMNLAYRDTLTGLPNRTLFAERVDRALGLHARDAVPVAVLLMDIDQFKYVNDTLGHTVGDLLLLEVSDRLERVIAGQQATVARLGGDEFAILLPGCDADQAQRIAAEILHALEAPMMLDGHQVDVRASIGVAAAPDHGAQHSILMRRADVAMYAAKRHNLGVLAWDDRYDQHSRERLSLMSDLRNAVERDELTLFYQPKVPLGPSTELHVEALVRWQHPARGLVPPVEFIPFAEGTGYVRAITEWVLRRAMIQCAAWRRDGLPMNVAINISARDLLDARLPERFAALLAEHGCQARWFALEITESAILDDPGHAVENLMRLAALGCRLAIDDYGTGYSSLSYMRRLPVHEIKIDKSFVMNMAKDASDAMIVRSTIELAHNMGLTVVAEGVDEEAVLERLRALGCDMVQGYLLSRPLRSEEVATRMRAGELRPTATATATLRIAKR